MSDVSEALRHAPLSGSQAATQARTSAAAVTLNPLPAVCSQQLLLT